MNHASSIRRARAAAALCFAALAVTAAPASADTVSATTNRGGACKITSSATPATGLFHEVTYGVDVKSCRGHFGIKNAVAVGTLFDAAGLVADTIHWAPGDIPYTPVTDFSSLTREPVLSRVSVTVQLKARRSARTQNPERWREHEPNCRVATTKTSRDSLKCILLDPV